MGFSSNLAEIRRSKNLTQTELGSLLDPPALQKTISHYECGRQRPPMKRLIELATVLDVSVDVLIRDNKRPAGEGSDALHPATTVSGTP
jgi:transcriptional regulator with XRE-family HTH domain